MPNVEDVKSQVKAGVKKPDEPAGGKAPENNIKQRTQREMEAGKRAVERRKAETQPAEKPEDK